ncbi:MAG TPA: hypothetical protein DCL48_08355, partial [Alphaproteobacteria bacterium]|nr:hypothetical protein [Alphaproteobacteria bacterium]
GGVRSLTPTAWTAQSKPFWLTELGCPAVDKGANQPNVFYDPKSSESALPFFSSGRRDDVIQRQYIQAMLDYWDPVAGNNPVSGVYGGRMIDMARVFVWAWDARPYPEFPSRAEIWSDSGNWERGHWINGRMGLVPVGDAASELCAQAGITDADTAEVSETLTGFVVNDTAPPRAALEALGSAYHLDLFESAGTIRIRPKGRPPVSTIAESDLALSEGDAERFEVTRAQETDLPPAVRVAYSDAWANYRAGLAEARRPAASGQRIARLNLDLVLESAQAQGIADRLLAQAWASRETVRFALAPSKLALEPGDTLSWAVSSPSHMLTVTDLTDAGAREIEAQRIEPSILLPASNANRTRNDRVPLVIGPPTVQYLDLPLLAGTESPHAAHAAAFASPWPGRIDVHEYFGLGSQVLVSLTAPAIMGETTTAFYAGPEGRWDDGNAVWVKLYSGTLSSRSSGEVLNGANAAAIRNADGRWEVFQFRTAELTAPLTYKLSGLLRGQAGTEAEMRNPVAAGAIFVLMNSAVRQLVVSPDNRNRDMILRAGPGNIPLNDARYVQETARFEGLGLRPLSPVHIAGRRDGGSGDVTITWVRRTRIGGDVWDGGDVPLNEPEEAYQIEILNGGAIIRTLTSTGPQALYTAAMQITDWGSSSVSPITVSIAQTSGAFGVGQRRTATLYV